MILRVNDYKKMGIFKLIGAMESVMLRLLYNDEILFKDKEENWEILITIEEKCILHFG